MKTLSPFFTRDGGLLTPNDSARGPWRQDSLHGRVVIGILGAEIERLHGDVNYMPARLTVDLYALPGMAPLEVRTRLARDGWRIKVVDAELLSNGKAVAQASCQFIRRTANAPGDIWSAPDWEVPRPAELPDMGDAPDAMFGMFGLRQITGRIGSFGVRRAWMSENRLLVANEPLTPFVRVAGGADYVSALANASNQGLGYINSDVTLYLHRLPATGWVGYETVAHHATEGVAIGHCNLYDELGRIGWGSVCALAPGRAPSDIAPSGGADELMKR